MSYAFDMNELRWYAITVRHQHERPTELSLRTKGFETLVPLYRTRRVWSDRTKEIDLPLFGGYVFCRFAHGERMRVLDTPGAGKIVGFGGTPAPIDDAQISAIQAVLRSRLPSHPWPYLKPGDRVKVERGPLRGLEGTLLQEKDHLRLVIAVDLLQRSVAVELEPGMVAPVRMLSAGKGN